MMIGALSRRQKVYMCGENSRAKKHTSCLREKREKRERKEERERRASSASKKRSKKKWKKLALLCLLLLLPSFWEQIIKEKEQVCFSHALGKVFLLLMLNTFYYPLSSSPQQTHDTEKQLHEKNDWFEKIERRGREVRLARDLRLRAVLAAREAEDLRHRRRRVYRWDLAESSIYSIHDERWKGAAPVIGRDSISRDLCSFSRLFSSLSLVLSSSSNLKKSNEFGEWKSLFVSFESASRA